MSAYYYLQFVAGIVLVGLLGIVVNEFVLPIINISTKYSTTPESSTGIEWYSQFWAWMPLWILLLLVLSFVAALVVRRRSTVA